MPKRTHISASALTLEVLDPTTLKPHPDNPNNNDVDMLERSIKRHGQFRAIVISQDGYVLCGNHTLHGAIAAGEKEVAVHRLPLTHDDPQALEILLADNRSGDDRQYDHGQLFDILTKVKDTENSLEGTLWSPDEFSKLLEEQLKASLPTDQDPDDVAAPPDEDDVVSKPGDVWLLGPHRLLVGDATVQGGYEQLLGDERADLIFTDPPYGVSYYKGMTPEEAKKLNHRTDGLTVSNDDLNGEEFEDFLRGAFTNMYAYSNPGAAWYVCGPPGPDGVVFGVLLNEMGVLKQILAWVKNRIVFGRSDYQYRHESIFYGWTPGASHHAVEDRTEASVWEIAKPARSTVHPTMKPVELVERAIRNSSNPGEIVLDPFGGSGTTLIASNRSSRISRLFENDPKYADVICRRYQEQTKIKPVLQSTGEAVDFVNAENEF